MTKRTVGWVAIIVTVGLVGAALCRPNLPTWEQGPRQLQSATQPPNAPGLQQGRSMGSTGLSEPLDGLAGCFLPGPVAVECLEGGRCPYEDGDPSGRSCWWVDPDTGDVYYVSSSEYRP